MVLRENSLKRTLKHLHWNVGVGLRVEELLDELCERLCCDRDGASMLGLEEHLKEALAQIGDVLVDEELRLVLRVARKVSPRDQPLQHFTVLLNRKPDSDQDEILVVFELLTSSLAPSGITRCCLDLQGLRDWVASAVNCGVFPVISDAVVGEEVRANLADFKARGQHILEESAPDEEFLMAETFPITNFVVSEDMLEKGEQTVHQSTGFSFADQACLKCLQSLFDHE